MHMTGAGQIIIFTLDEQRYGIPLNVVDRVVRMVAITHLPAGPDFIRGVINVQGEIMPVLDLRRRFGLLQRPVELCDQLIITCCASLSFALMIDSACEVREYTEQMLTESEVIFPDLPFVSAVVKLADGLILLSKPEYLLSPPAVEAVYELMERELP
jgi:purine-binding chemotaxis protein CheW